MKKILVSGGAGFIGSHLCTRLIKDGHEVICLDNLFTGSEENIAHLKGNPRFEFVLHDVELPYEAEVDEIYNLACPASPVHYQHDAIKTIKTSVLGAINMLGLAKKTGAKIMQASTSEIYGDPVIHPQVESYWGNVNPIGIRSCYDEGKRCAETLFMDYYRQNGIRIKIIRIFNTYGPRMLPDDGRVVSNFVVQALQDKDITIYGSGAQTRSFQYVDDLIEGMVRMMNTEEGFIGPVNLGNPNEFSILELAEKVIRLTGSKSKLIFKPLPHDDPRQRKPDITLAKHKLDWQPAIELEEGLLHMIEYFGKYRS
ncbi:MAG: SDR family oxidoreductase [Bacteroides stercoris]|jgi:UDP-glucuronate decarboxylase|uniref:UDP-glucuronic acid decarboxylase family protein n=1 Tax=Bacteroides sp. NSJ-48 TaxID=2763020 RepID=UPI00164B5283|nr:UDP-glucuronic acid decarboxylase family protein [Bacteroides sp. NSJ-48]MBC5608598.1 SDR family oxidoreductase [Bacteroides sp. NSJ-48]MBD9146670.1 SDR family oxidoreductase [Bacteroides stercoris]